MHALVTLWDGGGTVPVEMGVVRRLIARGHTATVLADPTLAADAAKLPEPSALGLLAVGMLAVVRRPKRRHARI